MNPYPPPSFESPLPYPTAWQRMRTKAKLLEVEELEKKL